MKPCVRHLFLAVLAATVSVPVWAQPVPAAERIDLMRQITTQWVRPNLLVVLDISGSMSWDMAGNSVGVDCRGGSTSDGAASCDGLKPSGWQKTNTTTGCSGGKKKWTYRLDYRYPSRMAMVKNALGNSVTIWQPPATWPAHNGNVWTLTTSSGATNSRTYTTKTCLSADPGPPIDLSSLPDPIPPQDLVGQTADQVNWGLVVYSGNYYSGCNKTELVAPIDTSDSGNVTTIQNYLRLQSAGGLPATGGTPTRAGLEFAKVVLSAVKNGGTVTDNSGSFGGQTFTFPPDPKRSCGRSYSVLLVTDGQSNSCNANGSYCWKDPATQRCDGTSGYTCPNNLDLFPAQKARELWQQYGVRTFAVGVSDQIGPCELNHIAYEGRTDASSPNGDAGFNTAADPRLASYSVNDSQMPSASNPPYAYFTSNAQEFRSAVAQILAALGTGDYTTSSPAAAPVASTGAFTAFLASVDYPRFRGHLYAYDISGAEPFPLLWDAGQVLLTGMVNGQIPSPPTPNNGVPRSIYTWKPSNGSLLRLQATSAVANQLDTLCGGCGVTPNVVDFILGNDGNLTGTPRSWKLGALVNSSPAIIGPPLPWKQPTGLTAQRQEFEQVYKDRHPMVWVGGSDGLVHAFDLVDGAEILAILPPDLIRKQVLLYNTYRANPSKSPTGQPQLPQDHIYGVANSVRVADIYDPSKNSFRTVAFITEGPGGTAIHALDITHPYPGRTGVPVPGAGTQDFPADPNYQSNAPFEVLWSYTADGAAGTTPLPDLRETWALPAVGMDASESFFVLLPTGYKASGLQSGGKLLRFRAHNGQLVSSGVATPLASSWVTNYFVADATFWKTTAKQHQPDNAANQALVGDLHGQLWTMDAPSWNFSKMVTYTDTTGRGAPLYYVTAAAAWPLSETPSHAVYLSVSGNFYESSPYVNPPKGWLNNPNQFHHASVHFLGRNLTTGSTCVRSFTLDSLPRPSVPGTYLSPRTQPTGSPVVLIPTSNAGFVEALGLIMAYDPDAYTCVGGTYLILAKFNPASCQIIGSPVVISGGEGASSGFVFGPQSVLFSKSFVGEGGRATLQGTPVRVDTSQTGPPGINWWREIFN